MLNVLVAAGVAWQAISPEAAQHAQAGVAAEKSGRMAEAIAEFRQVNELEPNLAGAFANLGGAYMQARKYGEAIGPLKRALELNPDLVGAHQMLGFALLSQGYAAEAIPHLERAQVQDALGVAALKVGKLPEAIAHLQAALEKRPNDPDLLYYLGRASGLLSKNAMDTLEAGYPDSARAHQALAESYGAMRQQAEAEKEYRAALQARPDAVDIHRALGQLYIRQSAWPQAEAELQAESKLQPGDAETAYDLGQVLLQEGKVKEARTELGKADQLRPGMPETLYLLGKAASLESDTETAERTWRQLLSVEKNTPLAAQAHFGLATLYRKEGKAADAEREMQEYRELQKWK